MHSRCTEGGAARSDGRELSFIKTLVRLAANHRDPSSLDSLTPSMLSPPPWPIIYWPMPMLPLGIW